MTDKTKSQPWSEGAAYIDGRYMPVAEAAIPILDWGYRRSDATYDVVSVWDGAFFRLDDHIARFRRSMNALRLNPPENDDEIRKVLHDCVLLSGLREAYVAVDCLRGRPEPGAPRHPAYCRNYIAAFAVPYAWVIPPEVQERGAHLIIADTQRIPQAAIDQTVKNFHWGDLTRGSFEALDQGADASVLLDAGGFVTEGPGLNIFAVREGAVATPDSGVLEGITRQTVMELCEELGISCKLRPLRAEDLLEADEIFATSTAGGIMPVSRVGKRILSNGRPGPVTMRLRESYWTKRAQGWHATPVDYGAG